MAGVFVLPPIVDGVDSLRINALFDQELPSVDLTTKETVVPLKYATSLLLAPSSELQIENLIVGLEVSPLGVHKLGFVFEVIQVVGSSVGIPARIVVRRADILDQGCPLMLQFDIKTDDKVWCFNDYGVQALIHTLGGTYYFNNNDTSKLIGFVSASTKPSVIAATTSVSAARPVTATLADQIMAGTALKNLIGPNIPVTEVLFPSDCLIISGHSVNSVLNSIELGSALFQSLQEVEAWTQCCQSNPEVQKVLPKFSGPSMTVPVLSSAAGNGAPDPPNKKLKVSKPRKQKVPAAAPEVAPAFIPPPPPPAPGGSNTRGKSASLCMKNCKYHVRALFLNYAACHYGAKCSGNHQVDVKSFSKTEMCNWVDATCKSESDYAALRAAIVSKA